MMHSVKWIIGGCVGGVILIVAAYLTAEPPAQQHTSILPRSRQHRIVPSQKLPSKRKLTGKNEIKDLHLNNWSVIKSSRQFIRNAHLGNSGGITSHLKSSYELVNEVQRDDGSIIHIRLIARDDADRPCEGGGDFWTATLSSVSGHFSTAGHIVDYDNGTYSVYFFAVWQGMSHVNITLIHPSAAVEYLREHVFTQFRLYFDGHFKRGGTKSNTLCRIVSTSEKRENKCVFSHPLALGNYVFICDRPDKNLSCDSLVGYGQDNGGSAQPNQAKGQARLIKGHEYLFKERMYRRVQNGPVKIQTHKDEPKLSSSTFTPTASTMANFSSGYWEGTTWRSLLIDQDQFDDKNRVGECLRDKHIFLIGDSTLGQVYKLLCGIFGVSSAPGTKKAGALSNHLFDYNITMWRSIHHIKVGREKSDFNGAVFEVDVLDSLGKESSCDYVIIFGFGVHFRQWSRSAFTARVTHIKSAILRFRKRCPFSPIIIKSPHKARNIKITTNINESAISNTDWFVYEIVSIMKLHFQNAGVLLLDVWDMNLAFPAPDENHMPETVVAQELYLMLSMICL